MHSCIVSTAVVFEVLVQTFRMPRKLCRDRIRCERRENAFELERVGWPIRQRRGSVGLRKQSALSRYLYYTTIGMLLAAIGHGPSRLEGFQGMIVAKTQPCRLRHASPYTTTLPRHESNRAR
jgi:hypothetical protein